MYIDLVNAAAVIREQLLKAVEEAAGEDLTFAVGQIEMEFTIELQKGDDGTIGVKAWVASGDVKTSDQSSVTHKVKLTLTPRAPSGGELLVGAKGALPPDIGPNRSLGR